MGEVENNGSQSATAPVRATLSANGRQYLILDAQARTVRLYDVTSGTEVTFPTASGDSGPFLKMSQQAQLSWAGFAPDGKHVITVGGDQVQLWDVDATQIQQQRLRMNFSPHGVVISAKYSTDGKQIVSGSWDGTAIIWDAESGSSKIKLTGQHVGRVHWSAFSPDADSRFVLTAGDDRSAVLWEAKTGTFIRRFGGVTSNEAKVNQADLSGHTGAVLCAAFSPNMDRVLTSSADGTILIWNLGDGTKPIARFTGHRGPVLSAVFSQDGRRVLTGSADNTARVWNSVSGKPELLLQGHTAAVNSVAFSADGKRALTGSADFSAKIWGTTLMQAGDSPAFGKELLTLSGHTRGLTSVDFAPDGSSVLTGSEDGTAVVWHARPWNTLRTQ